MNYSCSNVVLSHQINQLCLRSVPKIFCHKQDFFFNLFLKNIQVSNLSAQEIGWKCCRVEPTWTCVRMKFNDCFQFSLAIFSSAILKIFVVACSMLNILLDDVYSLMWCAVKSLYDKFCYITCTLLFLDIVTKKNQNG